MNSSRRRFYKDIKQIGEKFSLHFVILPIEINWKVEKEGLRGRLKTTGVHYDTFPYIQPVRQRAKK